MLNCNQIKEIEETLPDIVILENAKSKVHQSLHYHQFYLKTSSIWISRKFGEQTNYCKVITPLGDSALIVELSFRSLIHVIIAPTTTDARIVEEYELSLIEQNSLIINKEEICYLNSVIGSEAEVRGIPSLQYFTF